MLRLLPIVNLTPLTTMYTIYSTLENKKLNFFFSSGEELISTTVIN